MVCQIGSAFKYLNAKKQQTGGDITPQQNKCLVELKQCLNKPEPKQQSQQSQPKKTVNYKELWNPIYSQEQIMPDLMTNVVNDKLSKLKEIIKQYLITNEVGDMEKYITKKCMNLYKIKLTKIAETTRIFVVKLGDKLIAKIATASPHTG
jgi:hypothetical protein